MWYSSVVLALCCTVVQGRYFGNYQCDGGRDVIVHLFEWKWSDIEAHCPGLADEGFCAVQVSPPQEHIINTWNYEPWPWHQRYQPVSYAMDSRSGTEAEFRSMVNACGSAGVKIYVDAVINHMTGGGSGTGTAGNWWDAGDNDGGQDYPGVPFGENDFNGHDMCFTSNMEINDYSNVNEVRNCRLLGLRDLRLGATYVQGKVREYMQKLVDWGVAGFRVDAAKHMWPDDMSEVFDPLSGTPFIFQEVIDQGGEPITKGEYTGIGRVTEFMYGIKIGEVIRKANGQMLKNLFNFGEAWDNFEPGMDVVVFVDNHDNQRGRGGSSQYILTHEEPKLYKMANVFMLAWNYGYPRVMSSYSFSDKDQSPPHDGNGNTLDVDCFDGPWVCEHAWRQIYHMVTFHNVAIGQPISNWWDNGFHAIAFSRGDKGFVAINNEDFDITQSFQTGLPAGEYCDVISCDGNHRPPCGGAECRGSITVDGSGQATVTIPGTNADDPYVAYHV